MSDSHARTLTARRHKHDFARPARRLLLAFYSLAVLAFLVLPMLIVIPMAFSSASSLTFPPPGLSLRWFETLFTDQAWRTALLNSLLIALSASTLSLIVGSLAAYGLVRHRPLGRSLVEANFVAPLILPSVVLSVALYIVFSRLGVLGTFSGIVLGHTILCAPYIVILLTVAIRSFDERIELVAATLGASQTRILLQIVAPNVWPSILAAWLFAFITSFDEVIVTLFISGKHMTIPKKMFNELVMQINPTITAVATLLIILSVAVLCIAALLIGRKTIAR